MLNPFLIEKDTINKVIAIQDTVKQLRVAFSLQILQGDKEALEPKLRQELQSYVTHNVPLANRFACKLCKKEFNDGRKLGGHVSRAHKNRSDEMVNEDSEEEITVRRNIRSKRRGNQTISRMDRFYQKRPVREEIFQQN